MNGNAKLFAVMIIFCVTVIGGVILVAFKEREVGSNMITAGISFATGAGLMIIDGGNGRRGRESLPPPFKQEEKS